MSVARALVDHPPAGVEPMTDRMSDERLAEIEAHRSPGTLHRGCLTCELLAEVRRARDREAYWGRTAELWRVHLVCEEREACLDVVMSASTDPLPTLRHALTMLTVERDEARRERDEARAQLRGLTDPVGDREAAAGPPVASQDACANAGRGSSPSPSALRQAAPIEACAAPNLTERAWRAFSDRANAMSVAVGEVNAAETERQRAWDRLGIRRCPRCDGWGTEPSGIGTCEVCGGHGAARNSARAGEMRSGPRDREAAVARLVDAVNEVFKDMGYRLSKEQPR